MFRSLWKKISEALASNPWRKDGERPGHGESDSVVIGGGGERPEIHGIQTTTQTIASTHNAVRKGAHFPLYTNAGGAPATMHTDLKSNRQHLRRPSMRPARLRLMGTPHNFPMYIEMTAADLQRCTLSVSASCSGAGVHQERHPPRTAQGESARRGASLVLRRRTARPAYRVACHRARMR